MTRTNSFGSKSANSTRKHKGKSAVGGRDDQSARSGSSRHRTSNGHAGHNPQIPASVSFEPGPHWKVLWERSLPLLLDPADVHSTMEACMTKVTDKLSVTEITFLQRRVRQVMAELSLSAAEPTKKRSFLGSSSGPQSAQEKDKEGRSIAEKHHLLTEHVLMKILPTVPSYISPTVSGDDEHIEVSTSSPTPIQPGANLYLLLLYSHECLWDGVAELAVEYTQKNSMVLDVNKYQPPKSLPAPPEFRDDPPQLPAGVSFHALSFFMALALRKYTCIFYHVFFRTYGVNLRANISFSRNVLCYSSQVAQGCNGYICCFICSYRPRRFLNA